MRSFFQDLRFGARMLRKNPGFSLAAILTLALGIGGNTAIFTVTSAILLKPLPYQDPGKLVQVDIKRDESTSNGFSLVRYEQVRDHNRSFTGVAVVTNDSLNMTGRGEPQQVPVARVSPNFFNVLGVAPQKGRTFSEDEGRPEGKPVVMISDSLWHSRFGGDPGIVGQTVDLDSTPYTIIGVLPGNIQFPFIAPAEVWSPCYFELTLLTPQHIRAGVGYLTVVARLRPEATIKLAAAEMEVLNQEYRKENPKAPDAGPNLSMAVGNLQELTVANIRTVLFWLSAAVGLVLLVACANVASLLLSRALARKKEIAVRTALGAKRGAVVRQLLTESVLLAFIAGAFGLGLSWAATRSLTAFAADNLPQGIPVVMDWRVLVFTLGISVLTGVVFGILPALQLSRTNMNQTLRDEGWGTSAGHGRMQLKGLLVVGQVAISLLLLIAAGLLLRSFGQLLRVDPGFDPKNVLTMNVSLPTVKYADTTKQIAFFDELLRRVSALPGVRSAAISAALPLSYIRITPVLPEGQPEVPLAERPFIDIEATSPAFLQTMSIPLRAGRAFTDADNAQAPRVVIINESLAKHYWPSQNAVGRHIVVGRSTAAEIVGVAADVKNRGLVADPQEQLYLPFAQLAWNRMNLLVRTATEPQSITSAVRAQIAGIDPDQPVTSIRTVDELMNGSRAQPHFIMLLLGIFSGMAIVLAIVGIYGVLAYSVAQRRQELGIRLALGAERSDILQLVVGQGMMLAAIGIGIGLACALLLSFFFNRLMSNYLYKVGAHDLTTFMLSPLAFLLIALLASYLPARRATQVNPTEALRSSN